jgi:acyl CoA:acetate/3-ketoacid CoA transferase
METRFARGRLADQGLESGPSRESHLPGDSSQFQPRNGDRLRSLTIAEVEELVEPGQLDADQIVTPGIYVDRIVVGPEFKKPIESRFMKEYVQR